MDIKNIWSYLFLLLVVLFVSFVSANNIYAMDIAVIANKDYPINSIKILDIKNIYLGEKRIELGVKIRPIDQEDSQEIKEVFIKRVFIGLSVEDYNNYWIGRLFREGITPPKIKNSSEEVIREIKGKQGGIGYVWMNEAEGKKGIKILTTIKVE